MARKKPDRVTLFWIVWSLNILLAATLTLARNEWADAGLDYARGNLLFGVIVIGVFLSYYLRRIAVAEWLSWTAVGIPLCLWVFLWCIM